jgi:hypothetical protein
MTAELVVPDLTHEASHAKAASRGQRLRGLSDPKMPVLRLTLILELHADERRSQDLSR